MKTNKMLIEKEIGTVNTGWLIDQNRKIELNQLLPYISKPEDIEVKGGLSWDMLMLFLI